MSEIKVVRMGRYAAALALAVTLALVFTAPADAIDLTGRSSTYSL